MIVITFSGIILLRWQEVRISNWDQKYEEILDSSVDQSGDPLMGAISQILFWLSYKKFWWPSVGM